MKHHYLYSLFSHWIKVECHSRFEYRRVIRPLGKNCFKCQYQDVTVLFCIRVRSFHDCHQFGSLAGAAHLSHQSAGVQNQAHVGTEISGGA